MAESELRDTPRYNIAPTQQVPAVRLGEDGKRQLVGLRWGLIPSWAKDAKIAYGTINARADTVATKPAFRSAYKAAAVSSSPMATTNG
jgi:putative SOS response-associated peptidase YedK